MDLKSKEGLGVSRLIRVETGKSRDVDSKRGSKINAERLSWPQSKSKPRLRKEILEQKSLLTSKNAEAE